MEFSTVVPSFSGGVRGVQHGNYCEFLHLRRNPHAQLRGLCTKPCVRLHNYWCQRVRLVVSVAQLLAQTFGLVVSVAQLLAPTFGLVVLGAQLLAQTFGLVVLGAQLLAQTFGFAVLGAQLLVQTPGFPNLMQGCCFFFCLYASRMLDSVEGWPHPNRGGSSETVKYDGPGSWETVKYDGAGPPQR